MNGQTNPEKSWPCAKLVEFTRLSNKQWLRSEVLAATRTHDAFIERAIGIVREEVLAPTLRAEGTVGKSFLLSLRRMGYSDEAICRALAHAWYNHSNHFELPELENFASISRRIIRSLLIALVLVSPGIAYALLTNLKPEIQQFFFPLLGLIGLLLTVIIYWLHKHHPHFRRH